MVNMFLGLMLGHLGTDGQRIKAFVCYQECYVFVSKSMLLCFLLTYFSQITNLWSLDTYIMNKDRWWLLLLLLP